MRSDRTDDPRHLGASHESGDARSAATMAAMYTEVMYNEWSSQPLALRPFEKSLVRAYCASKDLKILNVGCGAGRETFALYDLGFHRVAGVDCTPALLQLAKDRNENLNLGIEFDVAHAGDLPFPSQSFDLVTMFENVFGHITPRSARREVLHEVHRVLKPGGLVFLEATSIHDSLAGFFFLNLLAVLRLLYNPWDLARGDKLMRNAKRLKTAPANLPRSHWFHAGEVAADVRGTGLELLLSSTVAAVAADPRTNSTRYYGQGRFVYVLRNAAVPDSRSSGVDDEHPIEHEANRGQ
jgi:SAM-dependent methyltransferase